MKVFSRARIGLRGPKQSYTPTSPVTICSIHHGGPVGRAPLTFAAAAAHWRGYQDYHQINRGWNDIGYNAGVDGLGRIYAGRPFGALPAAVENHNSHSIGICFMQNGDEYRLNYLQRRTLRLLFEEGCRPLGIPPLKNMTVKGHREFSGHESNACPGRHILRHLSWRRSLYR